MEQQSQMMQQQEQAAQQTQGQPQQEQQGQEPLQQSLKDEYLARKGKLQKSMSSYFSEWIKANN
jgi:hypothetical protein